MPYRTEAIGLTSSPREAALSRRDLLSFAAGVDLPWPGAFDDAREDFAGFPTYCASLEFNTPEGSQPDVASNGLTLAERRRGVHAGQDSFFHAALRPGDRLRTTRTVMGARTTRAGVLVSALVETRRVNSDEPVVSSWVSQMLRNVELNGAAREIEAAPTSPVRSRAGAPRRSEVVVTRTMPHIYAECAAIWNPIHSERTVALAAGLPDIILQGSATWSFVAREVVDTHCGGDAARLARLGCRFVGMALPGDVLTIEVFEPVDGVVAVDVTRQNGAPVLADAFAVVRK